MPNHYVLNRKYHSWHMVILFVTTNRLLTLWMINVYKLKILSYHNGTLYMLLEIYYTLFLMKIFLSIIILFILFKGAMSPLKKKIEIRKPN